MRPLFVYGSLLSEEVLHGLLRRLPTRRPARLDNYTRVAVRGECFPAVLHRPAAKMFVDGVLLLDLLPREVRLLDFYEDEEYERVSVSVTVGDPTELVQADVYAWPATAAHLLDLERPWSFEAFRTTQHEFIRDVVVPLRDDFERAEN